MITTDDSLSALQPFQQACLIVLAIVGDTSFVALLMVLVRKRFFRVHCQNLLANDRLRRTETSANEKMASEPRIVETGEISHPIRVELVDNYIPDRAVVESPTTSQMTQRDRKTEFIPRRHTIRSRTLSQRIFDPSQTQGRSHHIPSPNTPATTGLGGFSVLKKFGKLLVRSLRLPVRDEHALILLTREKTHVSDDWSDSIRQAVVSWLPEGFGGLLIGRNSRFYTEELDDAELEQVGGVEYRALRFLSYFVGAVSPRGIPSS